MENWITIAGKYSLAGILIIVSYYFYDKNTLLSIGLLIFGVFLAIIIIAADIQYKFNRLDYEARGFVKK